jgi:ankyrin repeat protein
LQHGLLKGSQALGPRLTAIFERVRESALYQSVVFDDINAVNSDGDNALHWAVHAGDLEAARLLIESGIDVNQRGDLGRTPLHEACAWGNQEMVLLLVRNGADLYAQDEGHVPFTLARLNGHDGICDVLRPFMDDAQAKDPDVWVRAKIAYLERELRRLKATLE